MLRYMFRRTRTRHESLMRLYKVEVGSAMHKKGIRWTEYMESESIGKHDLKYMVLDFILTISTLIDHLYNYRDHPVTLVILIIIIISQVLGHTNFNKNAWRMIYMSKITMNKVKIKSSVSTPTFPFV